MSCEGRDDKFTIDELEVSTSEDADVECNYGMPDGSVCKQTYSCSSGGNVIKNSQCKWYPKASSQILSDVFQTRSSTPCNWQVHLLTLYRRWCSLRDLQARQKRPFWMQRWCPLDPIQLRDCFQQCPG